MMFYGTSRSKGKPEMVMISLADGHKIWEQLKLFDKNSEEVVSNGLATNDGIYTAPTKNIYKLNPATERDNGDKTWKKGFKVKNCVGAKNGL